MRTRMKIREGVARGLCGTCREAHINVDDRGEQIVLCTAPYNMGYLVRRPITSCNDFVERNTGMDKDEAHRIGWVLESKGGRLIGFVAPKPKSE